MSTECSFPRFFLTLFVLCMCILESHSEGKKSLTFTDIMKFKQIENATISDDGAWVAYTAQPDRGDGEATIQFVAGKVRYIIPRGSKSVFSSDAQWIAMTLKPPAIEFEKKSNEKNKPHNGMILLRLTTGDTMSVPRIESFAFSINSRWLAYLRTKENKKDEKSTDTSTQKIQKKKEMFGTDLFLRHLASGKEIRIPSVTNYAFDTTSHWLAYAVADSVGKSNGVAVRDLSTDSAKIVSITNSPDGWYTELTWHPRAEYLAFVASSLTDKEKTTPSALWIWNPINGSVSQYGDTATLRPGWIIPSQNDLLWSKDGTKLFFGVRGRDKVDAGEIPDSALDLFNIDQILKKREILIWHSDDPRIMYNQRIKYKEEKDRLYRAVIDLSTRTIVHLADSTIPTVQVDDQISILLGHSNTPYLKEITWDGDYEDLYLLSADGSQRKKIVERLSDRATLSPLGNYLLYYRHRHWYLYDVKKDSARSITLSLSVPFFDEDNDRPAEPGSYGFAGWVGDESAVLLYDKYDIWVCSTKDGFMKNITNGVGRAQKLTFRIQHLDPNRKSFNVGESVLLTAYHELQKYTALYSMIIGSEGVKKLVEEPRRYTVLMKAKNADALLYTRQTYTEFPDLWVSQQNLKLQKKITAMNPQIADYAWGSAELIEWNSLDGIPLQGVLIKPGNYQSGKRYPVIVYFYELFSQRLYDFVPMVVNHRPNFALYASNGYAIFLPDVRFEIGRPGFSATKCIVPGVQKLIDMGIADPKAIGLHGHSWSGYQTAFMITQTNMFATAIAGAPVGNMTSAYSGIRMESGLARQFQYEKDQSRLGGSLWEVRDRYIDNSPVFFADNIRTPLMIMFGDEDEAVPWQQGIELYLAMRRLGKECVFLQYRGEGHHPKKYPNRVDYAIRFKEWMDHYLKGIPAPEWMTKEVPYSE